MGLFRRRRKQVEVAVTIEPSQRQRAQTSPRPRPAPDPPEQGVPQVPQLRLGSCSRVDVVGESYYQQALTAICHGQERSGNVPIDKAVLIPEPDNPHDRNAVRVTVSGRTVGYLSREDAGRYQPPLLDLHRAGFLGWCPAAIIGSADAYYGVFLRLAEPETLWPANSPGRLTLLEADRSVAVTKRRPHHDVLDELLGRRDAVLVFGELVQSTVTAGKYKGSPCVEVTVNGRRIGALSAAMTQRHHHQVTPGCGCEVIISRRENGLHAAAYMPRP